MKSTTVPVDRMQEAKRRQKTPEAKFQKKAKRKAGAVIFWKSAYITAVCLLIVALLCVSFLQKRPQTMPSAVEEPSVVKGASADLAVFFPNGFEEGFCFLCLLHIDGESGETAIAALPAISKTKEERLDILYAHAGPMGVLNELKKQGLTCSEYVCLSMEDCDRITKSFGNLRYSLSESLSYYDPISGNSFLAAKGINTASGRAFCRFCSLSMQESSAEGASLTAELLKNFLRQTLQNAEKQTDIKRWCQFLLESERTNLSATNQEKICLALETLRESIITPITTEGTDQTLVSQDGTKEEVFDVDSAFFSKICRIF